MTTDTERLIARLEEPIDEKSLSALAEYYDQERREAAAALRAMQAERDNARAVAALSAQEARVKAAGPDYCYDDEWEYTLPWGDRDTLVEYADLTKPVPVYTLIKGPTKWAVNIVDGETDDFELTWFDSKEAALAALTTENQTNG
jgi:hypothetical protein